MRSHFIRGIRINFAAIICLIGAAYPSLAATVINPAKFGAKCDGQSDDTAAIQAAAKAVPNEGGVLQFSEGTCSISGETLLKSNTLVTGHGATIRNFPPRFWAHGVGGAFVIRGTSNVTIEGMRFAWQHGVYNGGAAHIIAAFNANHVVIRNNISDGGGDFAAIVTSTDVVMSGNQVTEVDDSCFDTWDGSHQIRVVDNRCTTTARKHRGVGAVQFTGIHSGGGPAFNSGFYAAGNEITINTPNGQAFEINGSPAGGSDQDITIVDNHITIATHAWGVLVTYAAHGKISRNRFDITSPDMMGAINVTASSPDWEVSGNTAHTVPGIRAAIFVNSGAGGRLSGNQQN